MNYESAYSFNVGNCPAQWNHCRKTAWYCKFIKPLFSFVVSVMLGEWIYNIFIFQIRKRQFHTALIAFPALSMSHLCEKYSSNNSFRTIKSDLSTLRSTVSLLSVNFFFCLLISKSYFETYYDS